MTTTFLPTYEESVLGESNLIGIKTLIASPEIPLLTQKLKLASPSVTKRILSWPSSVSGTSLALTAALRIVTCSLPPQPFGWLRIKTTSAFTDPQTDVPNACASLMYVSAQVNR